MSKDLALAENNMTTEHALYAALGFLALCFASAVYRAWSCPKGGLHKFTPWIYRNNVKRRSCTKCHTQEIYFTD